jgi:hypothetical protein
MYFFNSINFKVPKQECPLIWTHIEALLLSEKD